MSQRNCERAWVEAIDPNELDGYYRLDTEEMTVEEGNEAAEAEWAAHDYHEERREVDPTWTVDQTAEVFRAKHPHLDWTGWAEHHKGAKSRRLAELEAKEARMAEQQEKLAAWEARVERGEGPQPGTWAYTAQVMALTSDPDDGFDWDAWKDQMKEGCL